jgi:hypothetical protein
VLEGQGADPVRAAQAIHLATVLWLFQLGVVAVYCLLTVGFATFTSMVFWAVAILVLAYLMVRPDRADARAGRRAALKGALAAMRVLAQQPLFFARLFLFGVATILLVDAAAYAISQAFTTTVVVINVPGDQLLVAVVAGYIARLVQFTPGGLGQWEWGFAAALYVGGLGFPEAATLALLMTFFRYAAGGIMFAVVTLAYGVESNLRRVLARFA